jgi:hypothetical protein
VWKWVKRENKRVREVGEVGDKEAVCKLASALAQGNLAI